MGRSKRVKPRKVMKSHHELPAWYRRLLALTYRGDSEVQPWQFDEDLSELHSSEEESDEYDDESDSDEGREEKAFDTRQQHCECDGEDPDCACQDTTGDDRTDGVSNRLAEDGREADDSEPESEPSYAGSDAGYYYELKRDRIERKRELREEQRETEALLRDMRARHLEKEAEVRRVRNSLVAPSKNDKLGEGTGKANTATPKKSAKKKKRQHRPRVELLKKDFKLYSAVYLDHFASPSLPGIECQSRPYIEFYQITADDVLDEGDDFEADLGDFDLSKLDGHIVYLTSDFNCHLEPFPIPDPRICPQTVAVKSQDKESANPEFEIEFLGGDYLILRVGRDTILDHTEESEKEILLKETNCAAAPDVLEFVGIHYDAKKRKAEDERNEKESAKRTNREPSPGETFFEMSHPMGSWNQSRWDRFF